MGALVIACWKYVPSALDQFADPQIGSVVRCPVSGDEKCVLLAVFYVARKFRPDRATFGCNREGGHRRCDCRGFEQLGKPVLIKPESVAFDCCRRVVGSGIIPTFGDLGVFRL